MKVGALEKEREALAQHLEHMQQALDTAKEQGASLHSTTASRNFPAAFLSPATRCSCCQNSLACSDRQPSSQLSMCCVNMCSAVITVCVGSGMM